MERVLTLHSFVGEAIKFGQNVWKRQETDESAVINELVTFHSLPLPTSPVRCSCLIQ